MTKKQPDPEMVKLLGLNLAPTSSLDGQIRIISSKYPPTFQSISHDRFGRCPSGK